MKILLTRLRRDARIFSAVFFLATSISLYASNKTSPPPATQQQVSGIVSDPDGLPLPGVTVMMTNQGRGTSTDLDGNYSLTVSASDTLVFSYVGFKTQSIPIAGQRTINVQLEEAATALDAVTINAGYYNTTQKEATGNIAKVTAAEIENQPVINPLEALQGRMAGVSVVQQTGIPGAAPSIQIRGQSSLRNSLGNNGNLPLYIIDGVPIASNPLQSLNRFTNAFGTDPLNSLNPANIESIEVLKDADATAIYGSRGANGVILITTKTGKGNIQKTQVDLRYYNGMSRVGHFVDLLDTQQYLDLRRRAFINDGAEATENNAPDLLVWDQDRYTDWQEELFGGTAEVTNLNLNVSVGNETTSFRLGAGYQKQGMVFPGDHSFKKNTVNLNLNHHTRNQKFRMNLTVNYGLNSNDLFSTSNFIRDALSLPPNAPQLYTSDGDLNWEDSTWDNPLAQLARDGKTQVTNLVSNLGLNYELFDGLQLKVNLGYTDLDSEEEIKIPLESSDPAIWDRVSQSSRHFLIERKSWIVEPQLDYTKGFRNHNIEALVGATFQQNSDYTLGFNATGYSDRHFIGNLNAADAVTTTEDRTLLYKYSALFARLGYNWKRTYFINLTGRRDGSSRFGPDRRFANFGAIGASWIFSREGFLKDNTFLSFGKLRASYGITGNDQIGDYRYMDTYEATPGPGGLYPTQLTNPDFSWETNKKLEAGIELGFFKDRINLNLSWYRNRSGDQLVGYPLPGLTGFTSVEANLPATVENSGVEIEWSSLNVNTANLQWRTNFNLSIPDNTLIAFPNIEQTSYANSLEVGESININKLYKFNGLSSETGFFEVEDVNGDGRYDFDDRIVSIDLGRTYYGGLGNNFSYKNLSLNFLFEFVKQKGRKFYNGVPGFRGNRIIDGSFTLSDSDVFDNAQPPSQDIDGLLAYENAFNSDYRITDASFIRLKTFSLAYNLPKSVLDQTMISDLSIFVHGQNLFTLTDYKGLDPQNPNTINLPALQSITTGVNIMF